MDRRSFLARTAGFCAASTCFRAHAAIERGGVRIDTVSDGHLTVPRSFLFGDTPPDDLAPILARHGITGEMLEPDCTLTLLRDGERTVLFDIGAGPNFMPTTGTILDTLAEIDVAPEDVTHVVFTHGHPDHLWGVYDAFDDFAFPEAQYLIGRAERDYWLDPKTLDRLDAMRQPFAVGAKRILDSLGERLGVFGDGDEVLPGIEAVGTPGHTPGHMSFAVGDVMIVGDAVANHHVAFEQPAWPSGTDQDAGEGATTRAGLLDRMAGDGMAMVGFHLPFPGIGRVERDGTGYRFVAGEE